MMGSCDTIGMTLEKIVQAILLLKNCPNLSRFIDIQNAGRSA